MTLNDQRNFKEAYEVLFKHAETLRQQQEPNIDDLLRIVNESMDAYNVCRSRIDAVEKALEKALERADADETNGLKKREVSLDINREAPLQECRSDEVDDRPAPPVDDDIPF